MGRFVLVIVAVLGLLLLLRVNTCSEVTATRTETGAPVWKEKVSQLHLEGAQGLPGDGSAGSPSRNAIAIPRGNTEGSEKETTGPEESSPVASDDRSEEEEWSLLYEHATRGQLKAEIELLREQLHAETAPYYQAKYDAGEYEIEAYFLPEEGFTIPKETLSELSRRDITPDGEVRKVVLPEGKFPLAYKTHRQISWLMHKERELAVFGSGD